MTYANAWKLATCLALGVTLTGCTLPKFGQDVADTSPAAPQFDTLWADSKPPIWKRSLQSVKDSLVKKEPMNLNEPDEQSELTSRIALARLLERRQEHEKAEQTYRAILDEHGPHPLAIHRLGVLAAKKSLLGESEQLLVQAVQLDPNNVEAKTDLAYNLYLQERLPESEQILRQVLSVDPANKVANNNLGLVLGMLGQYEGSLDAFQRANEDAESYSNLAFVMTQRGELEKAESLYHRALARDTSLRPAAEGLIQVNHMRNRVESMLSQAKANEEAEAGDLSAESKPLVSSISDANGAVPSGRPAAATRSAPRPPALPSAREILAGSRQPPAARQASTAPKLEQGLWHLAEQRTSTLNEPQESPAEADAIEPLRAAPTPIARSSRNDSPVHAVARKEKPAATKWAQDVSPRRTHRSSIAQSAETRRGQVAQANAREVDSRSIQTALAIESDSPVAAQQTNPAEPAHFVTPPPSRPANQPAAFQAPPVGSIRPMTGESPATPLSTSIGANHNRRTARNQPNYPSTRNQPTQNPSSQNQSNQPTAGNQSSFQPITVQPREFNAVPAPVIPSTNWGQPSTAKQVQGQAFPMRNPTWSSTDQPVPNAPANTQLNPYAVPPAARADQSNFKWVPNTGQNR